MTFRDALAAALTRSHPCVDPSIHDEDAAIAFADPAFREALTAALAEVREMYLDHLLMREDDPDPEDAVREFEVLLVDHLLPEAAATSVAILGADPEHDGEHE